MWRVVEFWPFPLTCFVAFKTLSHCRASVWYVNAATQQGYQCMLLSPSKAASDPELCQSISHGTQLVTSLVITRIEYCNSILAGLPACRPVPLQRVQTAAARLVLNLDRRAHVSPALQQLHWLPVMHRVTFKITTLMHQILHKRCPSYLADLVTFNTTYSQRVWHALVDSAGANKCGFPA